MRLVRHKQDLKSPLLAMKVMKKSFLLKFSHIQHVQNELFILKTFAHPFMIKLINSFQDRRRIYLLFELVQGQELYSKIKQEVCDA